MQNAPYTTRQQVGIVIYLMPQFVGMFHPALPLLTDPASAPAWYFGLVAVTGVVAGWLLGAERPAAGAVAGPIAAFGTMFAVAAYLSRVEVAYRALVVLCGGLGALPGYGVYCLLKITTAPRPDGRRIVLVSDEAAQVAPVQATVVQKKPGELLLHLAEEGEIDPGTVLSIRPLYPNTPSWVRFVVRSQRKVGAGWNVGVAFLEPPSPTVERLFC